MNQAAEAMGPHVPANPEVDMCGGQVPAQSGIVDQFTPTATCPGSNRGSGSAFLTLTVRGDICAISTRARLHQACEHFGRALSQLAPEDTKAMTATHDRVQIWSQEVRRQGKTVDRPSVLAGEAMNYALSRDPEGLNPQLMSLFDAGAEYVEAYRTFQKGSER